MLKLQIGKMLRKGLTLFKELYTIITNSIQNSSCIFMLF